jgi:hypothetical protein
MFRQHILRVCQDYPHIIQRFLLEVAQQAADAGPVYLNTEIIHIGVSLGGSQQGVTVSKSDLKDNGRAASIKASEIDWRFN